MSRAGRKSGGEGVAENDRAGVEREVGGRGARTERGAAESATHNLLTVGGERGDRFC